jgi:hypothetical protein
MAFKIIDEIKPSIGFMGENNQMITLARFFE